MIVQDFLIDIPCPRCSWPRVEQVKWFENHPLYQCEPCGASVRIDPQDLAAEIMQCVTGLNSYMQSGAKSG